MRRLSFAAKRSSHWSRGKEKVVQVKQVITPAASQKIKNMSLLCALLVVSIHVLWAKDTSLSVGWILQHAVASGIASIAVPFFFVVSGFFLAYHFNEDGWWGREVGKRIKSLLLPFYAWIVIDLITTTPLSIIADRMAGRPFGTNVLLLRDWLFAIGLDFTSYTPLTLWYVRCLFVFALLGGIFKYGVKWLGIYWLVITFLVDFFCAYIPYEALKDVLTHGAALGALYFCIGVFIQSRGFSDRHHPLCAILCALIGLSLLTLRILFAYKGICPFWRMACVKLSIPLVMYAIWNFMTTMKLPSWLTACSFPIYLIHMLLMSYMAIALKRLTFGELTQAFIMFFGSIAGSIGITLLLRRYTPKVSAILFGGR